MKCHCSYSIICTSALIIWISTKLNLFLSWQLYNAWCQDPPLKLSIDESSASEIEEESDGVWSIVGGKVWKMFCTRHPVNLCAHFYFFWIEYVLIFMNHKEIAAVQACYFLLEFNLDCLCLFICNILTIVFYIHSLKTVLWMLWP